MRMIARSASGLRHLRFAREVLASLEALEAVTPDAAAERDAIAEQVGAVAALVASLSAAVKPYRDFLERERTKARGRRRVAVHRAIAALERAGVPLPTTRPRWSEDGTRALLTAVDAARATRPAISLDDAHALLEASLREERDVVEPRRTALRATLHVAVDALHAGLDAMDRALRAEIDPALVDALYPDLAAEDAYVADDPDPDDDATAPAERG